MTRDVQPELLDTLPADDPEAERARADLRRVNSWMGHRRILTRELDSTPATPVHRIVELGAGDGTFALSLAARLSQRWPQVELGLLDRQRLVTPHTEAGFRRLGWEPRVIQADVFDWLEMETQPADIVFANLFLHHFDERRLRQLLRAAAARCSCFIALEPRRHPVARFGCELLWIIGCNRVTRHDARASVCAGFRGQELTALWPDTGNWRLQEQPAGVFSHLFVATPSSG